MSEFWLWFARPFAEFAGSIALLAGLLLLAFAGLFALGAYQWIRRKVQSALSGGQG